MRKKSTTTVASRTRAKKRANMALNGKNMQLATWEAHKSLLSGELKPIVANAMAKQLGVICTVQKLQIDAAKLAGKLTKADAKKLML